MPRDIYTASMVRYPEGGGQPERVEITADAETMALWLGIYADDVRRAMAGHTPLLGEVPDAHGGRVRDGGR